MMVRTENGHTVQVDNGHAHMGNCHAHMGNGHAHMGNGHAHMGNGHADTGNGGPTERTRLLPTTTPIQSTEELPRPRSSFVAKFISVSTKALS